MPIQEYHCHDCGLKNDELIRSEADIPDKCPKCGSDMYEQQVPLIGGYQGSFSSASTSPRGRGSFKVRK